MESRNYSIRLLNKFKDLAERKSIIEEELKELNKEKQNIENKMRVLFNLGVEDSEEIEMLNKQFDENKQKIQNTENELNNL